jgi:tRNA pseudouridine38-40 synthase
MPRNIKLEIEYDGSDFHGWQTQPELRTVQGELELSLSSILNHEIKLIGSGRTDVGVHALRQVANFETESGLEPETLKKALNGVLPRDIVVKQVKEVNSEFNARFSAKSRVYRYLIFLGRTALMRRYSWEVPYSLSMEVMSQAAALICGEHDFSSFCVVQSAKENSICRVDSAIWRHKENELEFTIEADRFLHSMVRILVGTLIEAGRGYFTVADFMSIMEAKDRRKAGPTAPACGLYLVEVKY